MDAEIEIGMEHLEELVERHMPLIIRTVSTITGRYVSAQQDDEFSIALGAFAEAVERYEPERGSFVSFASLVMRSRLLNYLKSEKRNEADLSLESLHEAGMQFAAPTGESDHQELQEEIAQFVQELKDFGLTLDMLVDQAPKHRDTRQRAVAVAERASEDQEIVAQTYRTRRLPVRAVARLCDVTEKIVKGSKTFILSTMVVFVKHFPRLIGWIKEAN